MRGAIILIMGVMGFLFSYAATTVVPGRTWWYVNHLNPYVVKEPIADNTIAVYGLQLGDYEPFEEGQRVPCYVVGEDGERALEFPVAYLRESDGQVWVWPELKLKEMCEDLRDSNLPLWYSLKYFGFWEGPYFWASELEPWFSDDRPIDLPILLYDFNYGIGDYYDWPWSGFQNDNIRSPHIQYKLFVGYITNKCGNDRVGREFILRQLEKNDSLDEPGNINDWWSATLIEGVGIVNCCLGIYAGYMICGPGVWIAPITPDYPGVYDGIDRSAGCGRLVCVRDADGVTVYGDASFDPKSYASLPDIKVPKDGTSRVYDLQGRPVGGPGKGIFIRDGKKILPPR